MRYLILKHNGLEYRINLDGILIHKIFEQRLNNHNIFVIDKSFSYDINLRFPEYMYKISNILFDYRQNRLKRIMNMTNTLVYNHIIDKTIIKDLIILKRNEDYQVMNIPFVDKQGRIKISKTKYSQNIIDSLSLDQKIHDLEKLRTIIFNTTILPIIKNLVL